MPFLSGLSSPLEHLAISAAQNAGVRLLCKRDDLLTPAPGTALQGNKVRKLAPILDQALRAKRPPLLVSFGGAYSNHASALATAGGIFQLPIHLYIRGEEVDNPVLRRAIADGAVLDRIPRSAYRRKNDPDWLANRRAELADRYGMTQEEVLFIPEGGTSPRAIISAGAVYREIVQELGGTPDYLALSAGTGGTAAGVILAATAGIRVEVFPALKGDWMREEINSLLPSTPKASWEAVNDYHFGGYGRFPQEWQMASPGLATRANLGEGGLPPLEAVYTAKLFFGVLDRIRSRVYPPGSTVVVLHTGGIY